MTTVHFFAAPVTITPADWPAWTNEHTWEIGPEDAGEYDAPGEEDERWWADHSPKYEGEGCGPDEPDWDAMAEEWAALEATCSGCYAW
ncbi:MAG: hypothetical protein U0800_08180 [Isosphaeraceae bacterium]